MSATRCTRRAPHDASPRCAAGRAAEDRTGWTPQDHAKEHKAKADDRFKKGAPDRPTPTRRHAKPFGDGQNESVPLKT